MSSHNRLLSPAELEALYEEQFGVLAEMAITEFAIPPDEAEQITHEAFMAGLRYFGRVEDPRVWLIAAVTAAARYRVARNDRNE